MQKKEFPTIIYGGGNLGILMVKNLTDNGHPPRFVWDQKYKQCELVANAVPAYKPFYCPEDMPAKEMVHIAICLADEIQRREVRSQLENLGYPHIQEFASQEDILTFFPKNEQLIISSKTAAWMSESIADSYTQTTEDVQWSERIIFSRYRRHLKKGDAVLDVGCGQGRLTIPLSRWGCKMTGLDISRPQINHLNQDCQNIELVEADALHMPFGSNHFDAVVSMWFVHHFPNWQDFLQEQLRVVKPGGVVIFEQQFKEHELYAEAVTGKRCVARDSATDMELEGADDINETRDGELNFKTNITRKELETFCAAAGAEIEAIMPHSLFYGNAFVEGALTDEERKRYHSILWQQPEENTSLIDAVELYENAFVSKLPYWFTRLSIVVLKKHC